MARRFFRRYMPHPDSVKKHRILAMFGKSLHAPNLWHLNRDSVSRAFVIGMFWAMIPMPFQMLPAALCALAARANIGLSVALVWITNPLTIGPIYYVLYRFGRLILGMEPNLEPFEFTYKSIGERIGEIWRPLYVGSIIAGVLLGLTSYIIVQSLWRWNLRRRWRRRLSSRAAAIV